MGLLNIFFRGNPSLPTIGDTRGLLRAKYGITERQYTVFVSYRRSGGYFPAKMISTYLSSKKVSVFFDWDCFAPGDNWEELIEPIIDSTPFFLLICSPNMFDHRSQNSIEKDYCKIELLHALRKGKRIIPYYFDYNGESIGEKEQDKFVDSVFQSLTLDEEEDKGEKYIQYLKKLNRTFYSRAAHIDSIERVIKTIRC